MKMEKGFKCPRYLKLWTMDKGELKLMMVAHAHSVRARHEAMKKKERNVEAASTISE